MNVRLHDSLHPTDVSLPTTAKLTGNSALATNPNEFMNNWDDVALKPKAAAPSANAPPSVAPDASGVSSAQTTGNVFTRMADRIRGAFTSVNRSAQKTYADVTSGAQKTAAKSAQAAQQSAKAVESSEKRKRSASMGTLRTQTNAMVRDLPATPPVEN